MCQTAYYTQQNQRVLEINKHVFQITQQKQKYKQPINEPTHSPACRTFTPSLRPQSPTPIPCQNMPPLPGSYPVSPQGIHRLSTRKLGQARQRPGRPLQQAGGLRVVAFASRAGTRDVGLDSGCGGVWLLLATDKAFPPAGDA